MYTHDREIINVMYNEDTVVICHTNLTMTKTGGFILSSSILTYLEATYFTKSRLLCLILSTFTPTHNAPSTIRLNIASQDSVSYAISTPLQLHHIAIICIITNKISQQAKLCNLRICQLPTKYNYTSGPAVSFAANLWCELCRII